jgi:hypothetical protein
VLPTMKNKIAAVLFLVCVILPPGMPGQTASPSPIAKMPTSSPNAGAPPVRIRVAVRCDEAAIRLLVGTTLRNELVKLPNVVVLPGNGRASVIVGVKLVPVTGIQSKTPVYAMQVSLLDFPAIYDALETAGLSRQAVQTLLVANEIQPIREGDILTFAAKDQLPAKITSFTPQVQKAVERARMAIMLNQQRKPGAQGDTEAEPKPEEAR